MATIRQRGKNSFQLDWYDANGERQRRHVHASSEDEAKEKLDALKRELGKGSLLVVPGAPTLRKVFEEFLKDKEARREAQTIWGYQKHVRHFLRLLPVSLKAHEVAYEHIDAYMRARLKESHHGVPVSKITVNKERTTLATVFRWAMKRRYVDRNPVEATEKFSVRPEPPKACSPELYAEVVRALRREGCNPHLRDDHRIVRHLMADVMEFIWHTGFRAGEVCALRSEDVDLDRREMICLKSTGFSGRRQLLLPDAPPVPKDTPEDAARERAVGDARRASGVLRPGTPARRRASEASARETPGREARASVRAAAVT